MLNTRISKPDDLDSPVILHLLFLSPSPWHLFYSTPAISLPPAGISLAIL
jgi:hypothetical protein